MGHIMCCALMNILQQHLPEELIPEVLSWLPVKDLTRFRCVCKCWNTLIFSNPTFIKLHLRRSASRNPQLLLVWHHFSHNNNCSLTPFPVRRLIENPLATLIYECRHVLKNINGFHYRLVGSCNGLVCFNGYSIKTRFRNGWLCFWNPATGLITEKLGCFRDKSGFFQFTFGYDNSMDAFKVVFFYVNPKISRRTRVRIFTLGHNFWRDIQNLPVATTTLHTMDHKPNHGVNLSSTLNWLAVLHHKHSVVYDYKAITVEQLVILSLDLRTETYTQFLLPQGFDEVPFVEPHIGILMDCLCFSHVWKKTHFVIWQMKKFGVEKSWIQLLKISYNDIQMDPLCDAFKYRYQLLPLCFYNGDTLVLACLGGNQAIIYNRRYNTSQSTRFTTQICWFNAMDYVESLISPY